MLPYVTLSTSQLPVPVVEYAFTAPEPLIVSLLSSISYDHRAVVVPQSPEAEVISVSSVADGSFPVPEDDPVPESVLDPVLFASDSELPMAIAPQSIRKTAKTTIADFGFTMLHPSAFSSSVQ